MNLQASLAFLLSVAAFANGQDDEAKCDNEAIAIETCMGEDGWDKCELCIEDFFDAEYGEDGDLNLEEESCDAMMTKIGKALRLCNSNGVCIESCNDEIAALVDCSMAERCGGYAANDYVETTIA